jgi:hypothetical protein
MLTKLKQLVKKVWAIQRVQLVFHTAWEAGLGVLLPGLLAAHSSQDVKNILFLACTTAAAAARHLVVSWVSTRKARA